MSGLPYLVAALALGAWFQVWSLKLLWKPKPTTAMDTFRFSIIYLAVLFTALLIDHYLV
jgi:protoheme IX farnesyltransferase